MSRTAFAQAYPSQAHHHGRAVRGGRADRHHRARPGRANAGSLGQTVIVENTTGAGGTIGAGRVARAAPDGYTIGLGQNGSHVITGATYSNLPYDLLKDFEPLSLICDRAVPDRREEGDAGRTT